MGIAGYSVSDGRPQGTTRSYNVGVANCRSQGDNISTSTMLIWMLGILRAPCTLAAGYSVRLLGGRPEGTTLAAVYMQAHAFNI